MIIRDTAPTQAEEPITSTSAKDSSIQAPAEKTLAVKSVLEIVTREAITVPTPEAPIGTSKMRQFLTKLAPMLLGGTMHHLRLLRAPPSLS